MIHLQHIPIRKAQRSSWKSGNKDIYDREAGLRKCPKVVKEDKQSSPNKDLIAYPKLSSQLKAIHLQQVIIYNM